MGIKITFKQIKKMLPYSLNTIYLSFSIYAIVLSIVSYIFFDYIETDVKNEKEWYLLMFPIFIFGLYCFFQSILTAQKTKSNWLRFFSLYLSGQIYFVIILAFILIVNSMLSAYICLSVMFVIMFLTIKIIPYLEAQINNIIENKSKKIMLIELSKKILPYTLNLLYLAFFILILVSEMIDLSSEIIKDNKYLHVSFFGMFLFIAAIIIAYKTKLQWLRFLSLYLSGQIYIVIFIIYLKVIG